MLPNELRQIVPIPQSQIETIFATYQVTSHFYREIQAREALSRYCEWYYTTGERHRQELQQMRGELNLISWLRGKRH